MPWAFLYSQAFSVQGWGKRQPAQEGYSFGLPLCLKIYGQEAAQAGSIKTVQKPSCDLI